MPCASAFRAQFSEADDRKDYVYLLARLVKSYHFLRCFFTYPDDIKALATFAEYVGPQSSSRERFRN